jgi:hypothetical protein
MSYLSSVTVAWLNETVVSGGDGASEVGGVTGSAEAVELAAEPTLSPSDIPPDVSPSRLGALVLSDDVSLVTDEFDEGLLLIEVAPSPQAAARPTVNATPNNAANSFLCFI